jgi:DNA-binding NtrC family response regulator
VHEDRNGFLWIGTQGGGLSRLDPHTNEFLHFKNNPHDSTSLSNDFVFVILENDDSSMWLGTYGGGLNKFDPNTGRCKRFTENDGLTDNSIYGMVRDDNGHLWISTTNGVSRFNPFNETFTNYNVDDGLQSTEFNGGSCFKSKSGEIFFGGINGFNAFYPENIRENENKPRIVLTKFTKFNEPVQLDSPLSDLQELKLSWKDYVFSFEFAALDYTAPKRNLYAFKMDGLDEDWIYADADNRIARYTTLAPGKYTFRVKGSNNDNVWNEEGVSLRIVITPPFWQSLGFQISVVLVLIVLLYLLVRRRMLIQQRKRAELEDRVTERTKAAEKLQEALGEVQVLKNRLQAENVYLQDEIKVVSNFENIITRSKALRKVLSEVEQVAETNATALVLGESGTGKELIARAIHTLSERSERILVKVNCSALPANLIESEFFGHEKGAFTGAIGKKIGRFELANGGTIFLDEIGDLPLELQAKLLRVLQEGEFERVGGTDTIKVDVRIIAATNRDLQKEIDKGTFREDLYFRLNVFPVHIPPLRERREDIPLLVTYFVKKYSSKTGKQIESVPQHVLNVLQSYAWPGNVRELENIIERAVITSRNSTLSLGDWLPQHSSTSIPGFTTLDENERRHIIKVLNMTKWRVSGDKGAAKILGINPKTLESRMKKLAIVKES